MARDTARFQRTITACIENRERLLEEAEWAMHRTSIGLPLAMLAQEEYTKAFVLALVRDGILPWTDAVRHICALYDVGRENRAELVVEANSTRLPLNGPFRTTRESSVICWPPHRRRRCHRRPRFSSDALRHRANWFDKRFWVSAQVAGDQQAGDGGPDFHQLEPLRAVVAAP